MNNTALSVGLIVSLLTCGLISAEPVKELINFQKEKEIKMAIVDDGVMGGLSQGKMKRAEDGNLLFSGKLSLENNGGFSSLRINVGQWDLKEFAGLELKVKGDGRTYNLRFATDERFRRSPISFQSGFATEKGEWTTVRVPFSALKAGWRGMDLKTVFDPAKIQQVGIILADKNPGDFSLEVESISGYKN
ncbi:CIA30 family protein [Akkermansiaceae bacterium]|nr:CIA30 family protein [Akkermansiaceae bacterium]MDC0287490.1 CIA30 family protein [Akkermansiaceae bacterium]